MNITVQALIKGCKAVLDLLDETGNTSLDHLSFIPHYNNLIIPKSKGGLKFSEDTTTLLNPDQIDEFAIPYLEQVSNAFNGGYVHYCGKNNHLYERIMNIPSVCGINFGNPEKHNMEEVLNRCAQTGKVYYGDLSHVGIGKDLFDYFYKCLKASYNGRSFKFLPVYSCYSHEIPDVIKTWKDAAKAVIEG